MSDEQKCEIVPNNFISGGFVTPKKRDHGGGLDAAVAQYGGKRIGWIDLSTGINPHPYPFPKIPQDAWTALPDEAAQSRLVNAARRFWGLPDGADILAAPGASNLIAQMPTLLPGSSVTIPEPTYNEHAAAFRAFGSQVTKTAGERVQVIVHPNNPDGIVWSESTLPSSKADLTVIDESFCDVMPDATLIHRTARPGTVVLKSFGKFWGLAGARLGFAIAAPDHIATLRDRIGPWAVSGPALAIGYAALSDRAWAAQTRKRLTRDSQRLDILMTKAGAQVVGGTSLFRLYRVDDAARWQNRLAQNRIWTRVFPYNDEWLRLGLPHELHWPRLIDALT